MLLLLNEPLLIDVILELDSREANYFEQTQDLENDSRLLIVIGTEVFDLDLIGPLKEEVLL